MRAQIVKINPKTVVLKNTKGVFATVSKTKLDFEYKLGDLITMERNGDEIYFLPASAPSLKSSMEDFWGNSEVTEDVHKAVEGEYNEVSMTTALASILFEFFGFFLMGLLSIMAICLLVVSFSNITKTDPDKKGGVVAVQVISIVLLVIQLFMVLGSLQA